MMQRRHIMPKKVSLWSKPQKKGGGRLSTPPLKEIPENQQRGEALPIQLLNQSRPRGTDEPNTITN
jgi:hypothetical protein